MTARDAALVRANAIALPLADESVDLVVTSPPYFALRSYQDGGEHFDGQIGSEATPREFLEALWAVTSECVRVLKPSGSLFVNLGDKYAGSGGHNNSNLPGNTSRAAATPTAGADRRQAPNRYNQQTIGGARPKSLMGLPWRYALGCVDDLGLILRAEIVWAKPNGLPESARDRVHRRHEQWFHLTREGSYFSDIDATREPHAGGDPTRSTLNMYRVEDRSGMSGGDLAYTEPHPLGKVPGSVWTVATQPLAVPEALDVDHFAAFPQEFPRRFILGWSPPGGVVLDPFGGTGTTAMVARALGRYGISLDLSNDYLRLARWRIFESGHAAKSIGRTNRENQGALL